MRGWERRLARLPARHRAVAGVGQVGELGKSGVGSLGLEAVLPVQATPPPEESSEEPLGSTVASSRHHVPWGCSYQPLCAPCLTPSVCDLQASGLVLPQEVKGYVVRSGFGPDPCNTHKSPDHGQALPA